MLMVRVKVNRASAHALVCVCLIVAFTLCRYMLTSNEPRPCVIYLHGNSGSRLDAADALHTLLPHGVTGKNMPNAILLCAFETEILVFLLYCAVFTFDFSGSGASQGEYVSLGHFEKVRR